MTSAQIKDSEWSIVIRPQRGWLELGLIDLLRYRDLIWLFVKRDFVAVYKQTILGPLWFFMQPLFTTSVFTIVFSVIAKISTDEVPPILFYLSGTVLWNYFANCLSSTASTFNSNASIFGKVYFPRLSVPIGVVITNLLTFGIQFGLFLLVFGYFYLQGARISPNLWILYMPVLIVQMAILGMGFGVLISSLTTKYRDLTFVVGFGVQLWMYATPIVYPLSQVPQNWKYLYTLNPMTSVIQTFRYAFLGAGAVDIWQNAIGFGISIIVLLVGIVLFNRVEKTFMDTI